MPDLAIAEVKGLHAWAKILVNKDEACFTHPEKLGINFFGSGESAYLVIDEYTSADSSWEYLFFCPGRGKARAAVGLDL